MEKSAVISDCGTYRYLLTRRWESGPSMLWIMLNPSTADAETDDPTITRCIGFARAWGFAGLEVVNLFAFRSSKPAVLKKAELPVGAHNNEHIRDAADRHGRIVCAWGATTWPLAKARALTVRAMLSAFPLLCLARTKDGAPQHPLFVKGDTQCQPWPGGAS